MNYALLNVRECKYYSNNEKNMAAEMVIAPLIPLGRTRIHAGKKLDHYSKKINLIHLRNILWNQDI